MYIYYFDASTGERSRAVSYTFKKITKISNNKDDWEGKKASFGRTCMFFEED